MTLTRAAVLRPGDWVRYDGADHHVIALAGTSVRLRSDVGPESVVLVAYLMASPEFAVIDGAPTPSVEPFGLLDGLPVKVLEQAREWQHHIVEVETGLPPNPLPGATPRAGFDPASTTIAERDQAKAAELGVSLRTVNARRARYAQQGLWGLVDQRAVRLSAATGRADARLVAAIRDVVDAETDTSTGTRSRLIRRVVKAVEATYGPGVVPLPGRSTLYKVIDAVATGRHTFGSAVTRRQTANRPQAMFTPTFAARPGAAGQRCPSPCGSDDRGRRRDPHDLRRRAAPGRHQGNRRGAAAGPDAGPRADAAGMVCRAADVGVAAAACPTDGHRYADGVGGGPTGHRARHNRDRRREGVHLRHLHACL
jgi:hypothetical protein